MKASLISIPDSTIPLYEAARLLENAAGAILDGTSFCRMNGVFLLGNPVNAVFSVTEEDEKGSAIAFHSFLEGDNPDVLIAGGCMMLRESRGDMISLRLLDFLPGAPAERAALLLLHSGGAKRKIALAQAVAALTEATAFIVDDDLVFGCVGDLTGDDDNEFFSASGTDSDGDEFDYSFVEGHNREVFVSGGVMELVGPRGDIFTISLLQPMALPL